MSAFRSNLYKRFGVGPLRMDINKLKKEQLELAKKVLIKDSLKKFKTVGGCDQTFFDNKIVSSVVVMDYETLKIIEQKYSI